MDNYNQQVIENDEISLKDLILLIKKYFFVLLNKWWLIGIFGILVGGYFYYSASKKAATYSAIVTYTSSEGSGLGGVGGLIGGFLGKGGGSSPLIKAQAMAKTRKIGRSALFEKIYIDNELDYLINHHGRIYELEEFITFKDSDLSTKEERRVFKDIVSAIQESLMSQSIDEESSIATMQIVSISEEYSIELARIYYESLVEFYKETEVGAQQRTLNALQSRADSIYGVIQGTAYSIATIKDQDKGIFWAVDRVPETQATTELTFLSSAYQELVKNLETIKFTVASNTPSITAIDYPVTPIEPEKGSKFITIIGIFIGCFLASLYVLGRQILSDILEEDEEEHLVTE